MRNLSNYKTKTIRKDFPLFHIEAFSEGKTPERNDDIWIAEKKMLAVIDGATHYGPLQFGNLSGGEYAAILTKEGLLKSPGTTSGKELVAFLTKYFEENFMKHNAYKELTQAPESRPNAKFTCARITDNYLIITQVGDVNIRINTTTLYEERKEIDNANARIRIKAIQNASAVNPHSTVEELLKIGREAIQESLHSQVRAYQNNINHPLGFGAIDGQAVPDHFINVMTIPIGEVQTVEIFSDGYFKLPDTSEIAAWEKALEEVEWEDPYKIHAYPSTKGSTKNSFTDDRTILIAKFKDRDKR